MNDGQKTKAEDQERKQQRRFALLERVKVLTAERIAYFAGNPHAQMIEEPESPLIVRCVAGD